MNEQELLIVNDLMKVCKKHKLELKISEYTASFDIKIEVPRSTEK